MSESDFIKDQPNIRKVYISDSPVAEDTVEYNYVSSDIEDEAGSSLNDLKDSSLLQNKDAVDNMTSTFNDVDELSQEAEYQRELQNRLQKSSLNNGGSSEYSDSWDAESDSSGRRLSESASAASAISKQEMIKHGDETSSQKLEKQKSLVDQSNSMEWGDPPTNPLADTTAFSSTHSFNRSAGQKSLKGQDAAYVGSSPGLSPSKDRNESYETPQTLPTNLQASSPFIQQPTGNYHSQSLQAGMNQLQSPQVDRPQYNYQQAPSSDAYDQDVYRQEYEKLQQRHLEQQQLLVQQQMLQHQQMIQHQQQMNAVAQAPNNHMPQRNAPVLYLHNSHSQNEYRAVTPKDSYHPYIEQFDQDRQVLAKLQSNNAEAGLTKTSPRLLVAPKPMRPPKNYVEKNKVKASGLQSAKPGYSQRLAQQKVEKQQMEEWAPGMIIPRKKAASADDIIRATDRDNLVSAEDAWSKRSQELANAKQARITGGKGKKKQNKPSNLKRYPSESSISKRVPVPPIDDHKGYLASYQHAGRPVPVNLQEQTIPGQVNTNFIYSNNVVSPQPHQSPVYPSNIPTHPLTQQYVPVHQSPAYGHQQAYAPQPQPPYVQNQGYELPYQSGPPSGGYHHQPRVMEQHPSLDNRLLPNQPLQHAQAEMYQPQPVYDYSGYLNSSGYRPDQANVEEVPVYDGSPYSSPYPPYSGNTGSNVGANNNSNIGSTTGQVLKKVLNPYVTVPPILNSAPKAPAGQLNYTGSYLLAHQKEKEKHEKMQKGPTYKVYTMKDYKNLKLEYKLGGLGPSQDQQELQQKNEIRNKQLQYAKDVVEQEKKKPHASQLKTQREEVQQISGRQLAVEYAKHIPKPKQSNQHFGYPPAPHKHVRDTHKNQVDNEGNKIVALEPVSGQRQSPAYSPTRAIELLNLDDLQRRHEEERQAAAEINYKLQQTA